MLKTIHKDKTILSLSVGKLTKSHLYITNYLHVQQRLPPDRGPLSYGVSLERNYSWSMLYYFRRTDRSVDSDTCVCFSNAFLITLGAVVHLARRIQPLFVVTLQPNHSSYLKLILNFFQEVQYHPDSLSSPMAVSVTMLQ